VDRRGGNRVAVAVRTARAYSPAAGRAGRHVAAALCPVGRRWGIGEGARASAAAARGGVAAAAGPGAQVDHRRRLVVGFEAAQ